jgi:hypothetical protein
MDKPQTNAKPQWAKPELTVLVRSHPEEAVLGDCKNGSFGSSTANSAFACIENVGGCTTACSAIAGS